MRKTLTAIMLAVVTMVSSCTAPAEEVKYSENILISIDYCGIGFGTQAQCADAELFIHTDRTVRIFMPDSDFKEDIEIGQIELSEEDYEKLKDLSAPEKITEIEITEMDAEDGTSYHIYLYGENDEQIFSAGGYMPGGEEFWNTRMAIIEILETYGLENIVEEYRDTLEG